MRTGDILVLMSKPSFDPNDFAGGFDAKTWQQLIENEWRPIQNRAISGQYPPGSTYKAIVAAAAMEEGIAEPDTKRYCPGSFRLGRRTYRCWKRRGPRGEPTFLRSDSGSRSISWAIAAKVSSGSRRSFGTSCSP